MKFLITIALLSSGLVVLGAITGSYITKSRMSLVLDNYQKDNQSLSDDNVKYRARLLDVQITSEHLQQTIYDYKDKLENYATDHRNLVRTIVKIAECESSWRPNVKGYSGTKVGEDIGLYQINTYHHLKKSQRMGLDIYDPVDNIRYALYLIEKRGFTDWSASKACWEPESDKVSS